MSITIMTDGSIKRNRKFGFELQSSRDIEKRSDKVAPMMGSKNNLPPCNPHNAAGIGRWFAAFLLKKGKS